MRERISGYQEETGNLYNLEATPAESTSYRLAKIDRGAYPDMNRGRDEGSAVLHEQLPPCRCSTPTIFSMPWNCRNRCRPGTRGGTVFHAHMGEAIEDLDACRGLVRRMAERTRLPYL